jgi:hypothetical protein
MRVVRLGSAPIVKAPVSETRFGGERGPIGGFDVRVRCGARCRSWRLLGSRLTIATLAIGPKAFAFFLETMRLARS